MSQVMSQVAFDVIAFRSMTPALIALNKQININNNQLITFIASE